MIKLPLKDGTEYEIPKALLAELNETYFDVEAELQKMRIWCLGNPTRRKTRVGASRFIVNWLNIAKKQRPRGVGLSVIRGEIVTQEQRERNKQHVTNLKAAMRG